MTIHDCWLIGIPRLKEEKQAIKMCLNNYPANII
jgi:hypothetical protein